MSPMTWLLSNWQLLGKCLRPARKDLVTRRLCQKFELFQILQLFIFLFEHWIQHVHVYRIATCKSRFNSSCYLNISISLVSVWEVNFVLFDSMLKYVINRSMHAIFNIRTVIIRKPISITPIHKNIDKLQVEPMKELIETETQITGKTREWLSSLDQKEKILAEYQTNVVNIKQYVSDLQTFLATKQIESGIDTHDTSVPALGNSDSLNQAKLSCKIDTCLNSIITSIEK